MAGKGNKRGRDGSGESLMIKFSKAVPEQYHALLVSQVLASNKGYRKQYVTMILSAIYDVWCWNGRLPHIIEVVKVIHSLKEERHDEVG